MQLKSITTILIPLTAALSLSAHAHISGYAVDASGTLARTGTGECVKSGNWKPSMMTPDCGGKPMVVDSDGDGVADDKDQCANTPAGTPVDTSGCPLDSDKDGVVDSKDKCPDTGAGVSVDGKGCPKDSDNDGIADSYDRCPDTAAGASVDSAGCEQDADGDGVADSRDRCPGTAKGATIDSNGCEVNKDSDSDGIVDANDDCPNTASGVAVNTRGCELKADIRLDKVQFKTATAELSAASQSILDGIAQTLTANDHLKFEVAGHTDNTGDYNYNVKLSESRAQAVRNYLIDKGVAADRLTARGYGPDKPIASNDSRDGRSQNRRVELVLQ